MGRDDGMPTSRGSQPPCVPDRRTRLRADHQPLMAFPGGLAVFPRRSQTNPVVSCLL